MRNALHAAALWGLAAVLFAASAAMAQEAPIQPGDVVFVNVFRHDELSSSVQVDGNGMIELPYVGNIKISGYSEQEASRVVEDALRAILKNPRATVSRTINPNGSPLIGGARTTGMRTQVVEVQNSSAESIYESLVGMATAGGSISFDEDTNAIIITDEPATLNNMIEVVRQLDNLESQITQVHIESKIAEIETSAIKEVGMRWFTQGDHLGGGYIPNPRQDARVNSARTINDPLFNERFDNTNQGNNTGIGREFLDEGNFDRRLQIPLQVAAPGQMFLGYFNQGVDLGVMLDALIADNKGDMLASPYIRTVNHKKATIEMTEQFPFNEIATAGLSTVSRTEFLDIGITLDVTPHVRRDPEGQTYIQMELEPEVSTATGIANGVPVRSVRRSKSIANVRDGQTLVIGGIVQADSRHVIQKVPGLGDLPVIGLLFQHKEESQTETELMIFVTPHVYTRPEGAGWSRAESMGEAMNTDLIMSLEARAEQRLE